MTFYSLFQVYIEGEDQSWQ